MHAIQNNAKSLPELKRIVLLSQTGTGSTQGEVEVISYSAFVDNGHSVFMHEGVLRRAERRVKDSDVLNLQFTSGSSPATIQADG